MSPVTTVRKYDSIKVKLRLLKAQVKVFDVANEINTLRQNNTGCEAMTERQLHSPKNYRKFTGEFIMTFALIVRALSENLCLTLNSNCKLSCNVVYTNTQST